MVVKGIPAVPPYRVVRLYGDTVVKSTGSNVAIQRRGIDNWAYRGNIVQLYLFAGGRAPGVVLSKGAK